VFDDWFAAGPEADDKWQEYETIRGHSYKEALSGFAARHVYHFDKHHLDHADLGILALPAGKSGHLELGYLIGRQRPCYVLFDKVPDRWDVMYQLATDVYFNDKALGEHLVTKYFEELN
jgi:nucleoside 2-deoxyribosyltransferase